MSPRQKDLWHWLVAGLHEQFNETRRKHPDEAVDFSGMQHDFKGCDFRSFDLRGIKLKGVTLRGCKFDGCDLSDAVFINVTCEPIGPHGAGERSSAVGANLTRVRFEGGIWRLIDFGACQVNGAAFASEFDECAFAESTDFRHSILRSGRMVRCHLAGCIFSGLTMEHFSLAGEMPEASFGGCSFQGAELHLSLQGDGIDLQGAQVAEGSHLNLFGTSLKLRGLVAPRTKLTGRIIGSDMRGADLRGAEIAAELTGTDMSRADVREAEIVSRMQGAILWRTRGLWEPDKADTSKAKRAEWADFTWRRHPSWKLIRTVGRMRIFALSWFSIVAIWATARVIDWFESAGDRFRAWAERSITPESEPFSGWVTAIPDLEYPLYLGLQIIAVGALAVGSTVYLLACPDTVKEHTEMEWTRRLNQPVLEYRAASAARPLWRCIATIGLFGGGAATVGLLTWKAIEASWMVFAS